MKNIKVSVLALSLLVVTVVRPEGETTVTPANPAPAEQPNTAPEVKPEVLENPTPVVTPTPEVKPEVLANPAPVVTPAPAATTPAATTPVQVTGDAAKPGILSRLVGKVQDGLGSICTTTKLKSSEAYAWTCNHPIYATIGGLAAIATVVLIAKNYKQLKKMVMKNKIASGIAAVAIVGTGVAYCNGVWPFNAAAATPAAANTPATTPAPEAPKTTEVTTSVVPNAAPAAVIVPAPAATTNS